MASQQKQSIHFGSSQLKPVQFRSIQVGSTGKYEAASSKSEMCA
jgi:hypothetical protein